MVQIVQFQFAISQLYIGLWRISSRCNKMLTEKGRCTCTLVQQWRKVQEQGFDNLESRAAIRLGFATHSSYVLKLKLCLSRPKVPGPQLALLTAVFSSSFSGVQDEYKGSYAEDFSYLTSCRPVNLMVFLRLEHLKYQVKFIVPGGYRLVNRISCEINNT